MTSVIAYIHNKKVYMIHDSCGSTDSCRNTYKQPKAFKINSNLIIGFCDSFKNGQNLFFSKEFKKLKKTNSEQVDEFVFNKVIPMIRSILDNDSSTDNSDSEFIIAAYGRIFLVSGIDFSMLEPVDNFLTIGCGHDIVNGIINYVGKDEFNLDIKNNLIKTMQIVEKYFNGVQGPFFILEGK